MEVYQRGTICQCKVYERGTFSAKKVSKRVRGRTSSKASPYKFFLNIPPSRERPFARSSNMEGNQLCWDVSYTVNFQNEATCTSPARLSFVFKIPLCNLRPIIINSVSCDRDMQRAFFPTLLSSLLMLTNAAFIT